MLSSPNPGTLTVNDAVSNSFSGLINGAVALTKSGAGSLTISNNITYSGATTVNDGTLLINRIQSLTPVTVNSPGILNITGGTVGSVSVPGGTLGLGAPSAGTGILNTEDATFSSSASYDVDVNGTIAGTGFDQLYSYGTVNLGNATSTLNVALGFIPTKGNAFPIIASLNPINGTFASYPEGTTLVVDGQSFLVSYLNDAVTLTSTGATTTTALVSSPSPSTYGQSVTFTATVSDTGSTGGPDRQRRFLRGSDQPGDRNVCRQHRDNGDMDVHHGVARRRAAFDQCRLHLDREFSGQYLESHDP